MMNTTDLDPDFADAVHAELAAIGTKSSWLQRHQRHTRLLTVGVIVVAVAAATTGAAVVVSKFPGSTTVTPVGRLVAATHTGTARIDLGPAPKGTNSVILDVTCISDTGTISVPSTDEGFQPPSGDGSPTSFTQWDCSKRSTAVHIDDGYLATGGTSITINATPGTTWKAIARYGTSTTTPWAVNVKGQTYGQANGNGTPDLQGAQATNGKIGYIYSKEFDDFRGTGYINVYESDGTTVIGRFSIGIPSK